MLETMNKGLIKKEKKSVKPPMLTDVVYQHILTSIIDCTLMPGQRVVQDDLAASLGVSRAPVSHAMQLLKYHGMLQESGGKGLEVAPIEPNRIRDLFQVRAALDGTAARLAAERVMNNAITDEELQPIAEALQYGDRLTDDCMMSDRVRADIDFHKAIYSSSGNGSIAETMAPLWPHLQRAMVVVLAPNRAISRVWREHKQIFDSILAGDPEGSERSAKRHALSAGVQTEGFLRHGATPEIELK